MPATFRVWPDLEPRSGENYAMIVDPVLVSLVSAATALVASITGPFITLYVGRAQIKVAVLSTNRQKWIDGFRELVATFCSQVAAIVQVRDKIITEGKINLTGDAALLHQFERLIFTVTKIKLMINPTDTDHQSLMTTMQGMLLVLRTADSSVDVQAEMERTAQTIVDMSQAILRQEWLRVKKGA
jgi:ubiquinone biosynthesis protein UbiJ